jgi:hypothetical protein
MPVITFFFLADIVGVFAFNAGTSQKNESSTE